MASFFPADFLRLLPGAPFLGEGEADAIKLEGGTSGDTSAATILLISWKILDLLTFVRFLCQLYR